MTSSLPRLLTPSGAQPATLARQFLYSMPVLLLLALCPSPAFPGTTLRVVVISDINGRYGTTEYSPRVAAAMEYIVALSPDVVISTGDMVAGQRLSPPLLRSELEAMWQGFQTTVDRPLRQAGIALVMTPGNHDASAYPGFEDERRMYADYQRANPPLFTVSPGSNFPFYFSVNMGDLKLVSLDATRVGPLDLAQQQWLRRELQQGEFTHTLVFGHLPLQPVGSGRERDIIRDTELETLLRDNAVTAYLSGHHHVYYPGHRGGIDMLSVGNLGGNQRTLTGTGQRTGFSFMVLDLEPGGLVKVSALLAPGFSQTVNVKALPAAIGKGEQRLQRRDLVTKP